LAIKGKQEGEEKRRKKKPPLLSPHGTNSLVVAPKTRKEGVCKMGKRRGWNFACLTDSVFDFPSPPGKGGGGGKREGKKNAVRGRGG